MTTEPTNTPPDYPLLGTDHDADRQAFLAQRLIPAIDALSELCKSNNVALFVAFGVPSADGKSGSVGHIVVPLADQSMPEPMMRAINAMDDIAPEASDQPG